MKSLKMLYVLFAITLSACVSIESHAAPTENSNFDVDCVDEVIATSDVVNSIDYINYDFEANHESISINPKLSRSVFFVKSLNYEDIHYNSTDRSNYHCLYRKTDIIKNMISYKDLPLKVGWNA